MWCQDVDDSLEQTTLVVLLAVLAVVEGLHHLGVLLGGEHLERPETENKIINIILIPFSKDKLKIIS